MQNIHLHLLMVPRRVTGIKASDGSKFLSWDDVFTVELDKILVISSAYCWFNLTHVHLIVISQTDFLTLSTDFTAAFG